MNSDFSGNSSVLAPKMLGNLVLIIALVPVLLMSGCGGNDKGTTTADMDSPVSGAPTPGGTAVVAIPGDPGVLNPLIYNTSLAGMIFAEMHDGLAEMDTNLAWIPRIASRWVLAPDGLSLTYYLRPWQWSDGTPLTALDVVSSFDLIKNPIVASPRRGFYQDVVRAVAIDSAQVRYDFSRPVADPIQRTWHHILPYHITKDLDPAEVARWGLNDHPLSSGEFMLASHDHNGDLVLVKNPFYPGAPALLDRVVFRVIPEASARVLALESGAVDLVDRIAPADSRRLSKGDGVRVAARNGRSYYYLQWNLKNPRLRDSLTRRALSLGVDRQRIITSLAAGFGTPAATPIPPAVWNHDHNLAPDSHDPVEARKLLAAAGWRDEDGDGILERDGLDFVIEILSRQGDPVRENGGLIIKNNLAEIGVSVNLLNLEFATGLARLQSGRFDVYFGLLNANLYGDPSGSIQSQAIDQFNKGHYANAEIDSLLELALSMRDRARALPVWNQLQKTLAADPPCAYLFYPDDLTGISTRVQNVRPHLLSPINNLAQWWVAPQDRKYRSASPD